jgi:hypothetical protein
MYGRSQSLDLVRTRARWNASFPALFDFHITPAPQFSGCNPLEVEKSSEPEESPSDQSPHSPFPRPTSSSLRESIDTTLTKKKPVHHLACSCSSIASLRATSSLLVSHVNDYTPATMVNRPVLDTHDGGKERTRAIKCAWEKVRVAW